MALSTLTRYKHSVLHKYPETDFHHNYTYVVNSFRSQNQTCMTLCNMDDRTDKHLAKGLKACLVDIKSLAWQILETNQSGSKNRCPTNDSQHSCRRSWETSSFWCLPSSSFCHQRIRKSDPKLILPSPSSWPDLTTIKRRRGRRKLFHGDDTIFALMSPSGNKSIHVVIPVRMLMP